MKLQKNAVDEMDYLSLLASEAPEDGFESEIQKICSLIKPHQTTGEIAGLLANVLNKAFSTSDTPDMFLKCANKIKIGLSLHLGTSLDYIRNIDIEKGVKPC